MSLPTLKFMDAFLAALPAAYSYAWWLTGDDAAAAGAVRAAAPRAARRAEPAGILAAVRAAAVSGRTLCPASELALLHDGFGVPLPDAAGLAAVDPDDACAELAHGRLEALDGDVTARPVHPERLGGLAVANPADVAHARTCRQCERVRALLAGGRAELRALAHRPVPAGLAKLLPAPAPEARRALVAVAAALAWSLVLGALALAGG